MSFIYHPVTVIASLLIMFNDLFLKKSGLCPVLAGKLSDICLMILLPVFLCACIVILKGCTRLSRRNKPEQTIIHVTAAETFAVISFVCIFFTLLKLSPAMVSYIDMVYRHAGFHFSVTGDLTDIFCLPVLFVSFHVITGSICEEKNQDI